ncbi:hypothetical protein Unana1_08801 [Umbelopsis nana]
MADPKQIASEIADRLDASLAISKALDIGDRAINQNQENLRKAQNYYSKTCEENGRINAILDHVQEQSVNLEDTFRQIDEIEKLVNHVKYTFNQVSDSVASMEKSVMTSSGLTVGSIPMSFKFLSGRPTTVDAQTYFPPPREVDIMPTSTFFPSNESAT